MNISLKPAKTVYYVCTCVSTGITVYYFVRLQKFKRKIIARSSVSTDAI